MDIDHFWHGKFVLGMQSISFNKYSNLSEIASADKSKKTMLTDYFKTNKRDKSAKCWLYSEFPEHYTWDPKAFQWNPRKKGRTIGRIVAANPAEGERFFLCVLLSNVRGAESYDDLRVVTMRMCETYRETCQCLGLLEKDTAIEDYLEEAGSFQMPYTMWRLFATILAFCQPLNPRSSWDRFYPMLSEDFRKRGNMVEHEILYKTIQGVSVFLESMGRRLGEFDLQTATAPAENSTATNREITDEMSVPIPPEDIDAVNKLNAAQLVAYNVITEHFAAVNGGCFFVDGPGGTRKNFRYKAIIAHVRIKCGIALATASNGIAASNLPGGRTTHSRFKLPLDITENSTCNIGKQTSLANLIRRKK